MRPEVPPLISSAAQPPIVQPPIAQPPVLAHSKQRAPTLYAIIGFKLLKGVLLVVAAVVVYSFRDSNLHEEFRRVLVEANLNPGDAMFAGSTKLLREISPAAMQLFLLGTLLYGAFSLVEGVGLIFRAAFAGWMVIAESAVFVPLEIWEMLRRFSITVTVVLILNIAIVWYLYGNRHRLFHGH